MTEQRIQHELSAVIQENFNACRGRNGVSPEKLAAVILSSAVIQRIRAEAWDVGYVDGATDGFNRSQGDTKPNPYAKEES